MLLPEDIELAVKKRGVEPNAGGEIYLNCPNIRQLKAVQVGFKREFKLAMFCGNFPANHMFPVSRLLRADFRLRQN